MTTPDLAPTTPTVSKRLRPWLGAVLAITTLLAANSLYLIGVRLVGWLAGRNLEDGTYILMFLAHLVAGVLLVVPFVGFAVAHLLRAQGHQNRSAAKIGYALLASSLVVLATGAALTRLEGIIELRDPTWRAILYWLHVLVPLAAGWLFVIHRRRGPTIRWRVGVRWGTIGLAIFGATLLLRVVTAPRHDPPYEYFPSLSKSATGLIPARVMMADSYCQECHADIHAQWSNSAHRLSSFNNPFYRFSVLETRRAVLARDGNVTAARWCAGCHDPAPLFTGRFDDPNFDDTKDPAAHAGLTCTACHAIQSVDSVKGNGDFTIAEPEHYPFTFSDNRMLRWVNRQLVRGKPDFHKRTFLKPVHRTTEFCSTCHKVHLPPELNHYKWVRGQNHYDAFLLSGVSGFGASSFYYPPKAIGRCAECHMPLHESTDFGAADFAADGKLTVHDHQFPAANTALADVGNYPDWARERLWSFTDGVMRVDLFALREGGEIDGRLLGPLRPEVPTLEAGRSYLVEAVIRTVAMGHLFTQGTVDSNEVWLELTAKSGDRILGQSGALDKGDGNALDPWAHRVNVYMLDRAGNRIDRRNPQDIFTPLYNHQIPPGAADVIHYRLDLPADLAAPVELTARLRYRKFDTTFVRHVFGPDTTNELPILELASDRVVLPVAGVAFDVANEPSKIPEWQRVNDYGIGLLRKAGGSTAGQLGAAEEAFRRVEALGRPDGPLNLARVYLAQGTVGDAAVDALARAAAFDPPPPAWVLAWLSAQVNHQNGNLQAAADDYRAVLATRIPERGFDFSRDYRVQVALAGTLLDQAATLRDQSAEAERAALYAEARAALDAALGMEPELLGAHYLMVRLATLQGDRELAAHHLPLVERYREDNNAREVAVAAARARDPAADHAAEAIVVYPLPPPGSPPTREQLALLPAPVDRDASPGAPAHGRELLAAGPPQAHALVAAHAEPAAPVPASEPAAPTMPAGRGDRR